MSKGLGVFYDFHVGIEMAINATGVTVSFPALKADAIGQTVEVKDATGTVYAVKAADIAEGKTTHEFEFVTTVADAKLVGTWTVDGKSFDLDLSSNLKAFNDAGTDQIKLNKALTDLGIADVKVENMKAYADAHTAFLAELAEDEVDLSVSAIQAFVTKVNATQITAGEGKVIVKAVNDAIAADNDVALLAALNNAAFVRVNADWLTGITSYKTAIFAEPAVDKDEVKEIQALIDGINDGKVSAVTQAGIVKKDLVEAKGLVATFSTPDTKGEQTAATVALLKKINIQLALVDVLEATTPNNFKAKLTALAALVDVSATLDMKDYVDANGQAYINALKAPGLADTAKDTVTEVKDILFDASTGVNFDQAALLVADVLAKATAPVDADKLLKALNNLGVKQAGTINKARYVLDAGDFETAAATVGGTKAKVQVQVDKSNLLAVTNATEANILEKLSVFGLDNVIAANAKAYHTAAATLGAAASADVGGDNAKTVAAVKILVAAQNKLVTEAAQLKVINEATTVAQVKVALDELANAEVSQVATYITVRSADRDFVAAYVLDERAEEVGTTAKQYDDLAALKVNVDASVSARSTSLGLINALEIDSAIVDVVAALDSTLDEAYSKLSPTQKVNKAEEFQNKLTFKEDGTIKTPFVTLAAAKALLN